MNKLLSAMIVLGLALSSCGGSDDNTNNPNDTQVTQDSTGGEDLEWGENYVSLLPDLTGAVYRVTMLKGIDPTDLINPAWRADIETYALVILLRVVEHDTTTGEATIEITSANAETETDGEGNITPISYTFALEPSTFNTKINGLRFRIDDPIALNIVTNTVSKPFHIFGVTGFGDFNSDGSKILEARLEGNISEEETKDLCLTIPGVGEPNFHWFMNLAAICPDFDTDGDDQFDAYFFKGYLGATREDGLFQEGIDPIEALVDACETNEEQCVPKD